MVVRQITKRKTAVKQINDTTVDSDIIIINDTAVDSITANSNRASNDTVDCFTIDSIHYYCL